MVAARGDDTEPVPLDQVAGQLNLVSPDHSWLQSARRVARFLETSILNH
jgi:6-phosphofructokinase 1